VVPLIGDVEIPLAVQHQSCWFIQCRVAGGPIITVKLSLSCSNQGGDDSSHRINPSNPMIQGIGNIQMTLLVDHDGCREMELRLYGRSTVTAKPFWDGRTIAPIADRSTHIGMLCIVVSRTPIRLICKGILIRESSSRLLPHHLGR
jgi:hypothetical protein